MEPVSSGISWSTSYGLGTIQVTFETNVTLPKCIYSNVFLHEVIFYDFLWFTDLIYLIVYFETCTVYICTPIYSRILAYWLMLSVLQMTENKFYLILSYCMTMTS